MCYSQRQRFFFRGYVYHREKSSCSRTEKTLSFLTANDNSIHMKIFFFFSFLYGILSSTNALFSISSNKCSVYVGKMLASLKNTLSASPSLYEDVNIFRFSSPLLQLAFVQYRAEKRTRKKNTARRRKIGSCN